MIIAYSITTQSKHKKYSRACWFGFNGMEKDDDVSGGGNSYTTQNRQLDTRLGRWFSVDPILHHNWSPYNAFDANPIIYTDILGTTVGYGGTAEQAKATETKVKDLTDEKSANYNKAFTEKFNKLATDQNNHFIFEEWTTTKTDENNRLVGGQFAPSTLGKTASGQNQMSISFTTNLPSHFQDHSLGPLFEEVDHAVQFQEGRLSYVTRIDEKILSPAYDAFDEADNKLAKGEMIKSFASGSTYAKEPLFGLTQKIVTGKITRDQLVKKMASQYKLPIENIDAFQGVSRAYKREDGFTPYSPDYIKSMHNQGSTPNTVFIGLPKTQ
jgi:RHS repeat-associated protein